MNNLVPIGDIQTMAEVAAKSKMFGFKSTEEAMAIMLLCQAENLHPAIAMRDFHVIQGRPALKADAMLARFQQAGGSVKWEVYTDEQVTGIFSHPQGGTLEVSWLLSKAKLIGIASKDNWKNYPRAMLRARCISEGIRAVYPGCVVGVYTPEETENFSPPRQDQAPLPQAPVTLVKEVVTEDFEDADGAFKLMVPNSDKPYSTHHTLEEWTEGYVSMAVRINTSTKFDFEQKLEKLAQLSECNTEFVMTLNSIDKAKIKAALASEGVNVDPKRELSLIRPDLEHSDTES
jgi:hypothetical protein